MGLEMAKAGEPREIAVVRTYDEFMAALRARVTELGISYESLDQVAGYTDTYSTKLLAPHPIKYLGPMSFGSILGALGLLVVVIEDAEALAKARRHQNWTLRKAVLNAVEHHPITIRFTRRHMRKIARMSGPARMLKIPRKQRRAIARHAATVRWDRVKAVARAPANHAADTRPAATPQPVTPGRRGRSVVPGAG